MAREIKRPQQVSCLPGEEFIAAYDAPTSRGAREGEGEDGGGREGEGWGGGRGKGGGGGDNGGDAQGGGAGYPPGAAPAGAREAGVQSVFKLSGHSPYQRAVDNDTLGT